MKKLLLSLSIMGIAFTTIQAQAPSYKDFEWDVIKLGYVLPSGDNYTSGTLVGGELRLNLRDYLSIGLRTETAIFTHDFGDNFDVDGTWSWVVTADYYLTTNSAYRTFFGLGFGAFKAGNIKEIDDDIIVTDIPGTNSVGLVPRIGYEFNHLRLSAEYNIMFKEEAINYFTFSAALTLWGGYNGNR